jgi:uncharacterized membrane protein
MKSKTFIFSSIILAIISLVSATILTLEKIQLWKDPSYVPSCSWNPLFSCQGPMNSWQSSLFVIPNPIIGMMGFAMVITILIISLSVTFPKKIWGLYLIGIALAFIFIIWLMFQTLYVIGALCIYCMVVWAALIPLFWLTAAAFVKEYYSKSKLMIISSMLPSFIIITYGIFIALIYTQFHTFFNQLIT